jgi:hypothetical protein
MTMSDKSPVQADDRTKRIVEDEYEYEVMTESRDGSGCGWGLLGLAGCLGIPIGIIAFIVIGGANMIGGFFNSIGQIFNPPPPVYDTVSTIAVLESIRQLSQLTTVERNYSRTITTERQLPDVLQLLYSDRLVYFAVTSIQAGIDIAQIGEDDIIINGSTLTIILPPPTLTNCFIDESASRVISRDTGVFASPAPNIESEARIGALFYFRDLAVDEGILAEASTQAEITLEALFTSVFSIYPESPIDTIEVIAQEANMQNMIFTDSCAP